MRWGGETAQLQRMDIAVTVLIWKDRVAILLEWSSIT